MNIFSLDYAVLLFVFFIVTYNVLKPTDRDNRTGKKSETGGRVSLMRRL
jgi:hypothetical protein